MPLRWIPNAISLARFALVGPVIACLLNREFETALLLFVIAGGSDGIDGFLARRFGWQTRFGGLIDPVADKTLVSATFFSLAWLDIVPWALVIVVMSRDAVIIAGAIAWQILVGPVQGLPSLISKLNTAVQLSFVVLVLCATAYGWPGATVILLFGAACVFTAIVSGGNYVMHWSKLAWRARHSAA